MSYMFCFGNCINCRAPISFAPNKVPSIRFPSPNGPKEPLCRGCAEQLNDMIEERGGERVPIQEGAYEPEEAGI